MDRGHPARLMRHAVQRTCRRVHADRDRGARDDDVAAVVARRQSPSFIAISSQGAAKDCALSLTWSGRAAENARLLKPQHRSRSRRRFPGDVLIAKGRLSAHVARSRACWRMSLHRTTTAVRRRRQDRRAPTGARPRGRGRPAAPARATHPRALRRGILSPANPIRERRRTEAAPASFDRG